jgi:arylsulfatase A
MRRLLCSLLLPLLLAAPEASEPQLPPPNVLLLLIDDMGYSDLPAFGSPNASTPHIDALIKSGARFTQWISAASICTPSRAALQTGRYPIRTGCMGNVERFRVIPTPANPHGLDPSTQTSIATALRRANYATGMSGKWYVRRARALT